LSTNRLPLVLRAEAGRVMERVAPDAEVVHKV